MPIFGAIGVAGTGVTAYRKWLDAVSDNLANMNDVSATSGKAYQARYVMVQSVGNGQGTGGVQVSGIALGSGQGQLSYQPDHPLADKNGYVRVPDIDMASQMGQLIIAQRGYQANLAVVDRAKEAYEAALALGRNA
jgi:flagellar basal-body rod protein FlgC